MRLLLKKYQEYDFNFSEKETGLQAVYTMARVATYQRNVDVVLTDIFTGPTVSTFAFICMHKILFVILF